MPISLTEYVEYEFNRLERFLDSNFQLSKLTEDIDNNDINLQSALYGPQTDIALACRAVYYELATIIEHEIQIVAYRESLPRHDDDSPLFCGDTESTVGANYTKCVKKIELALQFNLDDLPRAQTVANLREVVNSFKHRKGLVDKNPRISEMQLPKSHVISVNDTRNAIKDTRRFILALHDKSGFMKETKDMIKIY